MWEKRVKCYVLFEKSEDQRVNPAPSGKKKSGAAKGGELEIRSCHFGGCGARKTKRTQEWRRPTEELRGGMGKPSAPQVTTGGGGARPEGKTGAYWLWNERKNQPLVVALFWGKINTKRVDHCVEMKTLSQTGGKKGGTAPSRGR